MLDCLGYFLSLHPAQHLYARLRLLILLNLLFQMPPPAQKTTLLSFLHSCFPLQIQYFQLLVFLTSFVPFPFAFPSPGSRWPPIKKVLLFSFHASIIEQVVKKAQTARKAIVKGTHGTATRKIRTVPHFHRPKT